VEKRLALVNPGRKIEFATCEPLNLESIAAYVGQFGIDVKIIDELAGQNVRKEIMRYQPSIVGITGVTPVIPDAYRIADMCRKMGIRTVIGGVHASVLPYEALKHADIVVKGEGEIAMRNIIQQDIKSGIVQGITLENLDDIPIFDKSGVEIDFYLRLPETYLAVTSPGMLTAALVTSRGCSHSCIFCHNSWKGLPYRCNSVERVMNEIRILIRKYHIRAVYFFDDNLFMNRPRLHQLCRELIEFKLRIDWAACSRVDNVDIDTLRLAQQAGCRQIVFGFESGSQRILDVLNKKTTVEQNSEAIRMCHEVGILATGTFMIGSPTETVEDVYLTQQFIKNNRVDSGGVRITTPFPGTPIWDWSKERGLVAEDPDWSKFLMSESGERLLACDTIPFEQLTKLYKEAEALLADTHNKISPRWFANMALRHPIKSMTIALRSSSSWSKYLYRVRR
jgi:radical SAM superfamily enzyme YgiQ (UPF0313 family)